MVVVVGESGARPEKEDGGSMGVFSLDGGHSERASERPRASLLCDNIGKLTRVMVPVPQKLIHPHNRKIRRGNVR